MNSVDTNVVVRLLVKDDLEQYQISLDLFTQGSIFITHTVLLETEWVLRYSYRLERSAIAKALLSLLQTEAVSVLDEADIFTAIALYKSGMDFGDALHLCKSKHCSSFCTFDRALVKKTKDLDICPVVGLESQNP